MPWSAAAAIGGALISSSAASNAADTQAAATASAQAQNQANLDRTYNDQAPYRAAGTQALGQYQTAINTPTTAADVTSDPGYQFGLTQGQQGLDRKTAAAGGRVSGAALKAASAYATNYATTGYNAAYQRRQDRINQLANLAGIGQTATNASSAAGQAATSANSNLTSSQGNASAASQISQGNIWSGAGNSLAALAKNWASTPSTSGSSYNYQTVGADNSNIGQYGMENYT